MPYGEDPQSITGKIRSFFRENPDEYLTKEDLVAKFGFTKNQVDRAMDSLKARGLIDSTYVYRVKK
jgi:DNA-binding transcriptional MocR family regulator